MSPSAAVREQHARDIECAAATAVAKNLHTISPAVDPTQYAGHRFGPGMRDDDARQASRTKRLDFLKPQHKTAFDLVSRLAETAGLDHGGDAAAAATPLQPGQCMQRLL